MFFNLGFFSNPEIEKQQPFLSRILILKNENARNEKKGAPHFYSILQKRDFPFTTKASHCLLWPFLVSRCPGRCPGIPVSQSVSRASRCLSLPPQKCFKTQRVLMISNTDVWKHNCFTIVQHKCVTIACFVRIPTRNTQTHNTFKRFQSHLVMFFNLGILSNPEIEK